MGTATEFRSLVEFAIREECKAQELYRTMMLKIEDPFCRSILEALHEQEVAHEEKLRSLLESIEPAHI